MTTEEFLAWFEGFTGRVKGRASAKDWAEIVERVGRIESKSPLKAWFEGFRAKLKGVPSDNEWRQIKARVGEEVTKASKVNRLRDPFEVYDKKAEPASKGEAKPVRYPGAAPFGKKK